MRRISVARAVLALVAVQSLVWSLAPLVPVRAQEAPAAAEAPDQRTEQRRPDAQGQKGRRPPDAQPRAGDAERPQQTVPRLPAEARTEHALALEGRTLGFTASAGSIPITNTQGRTLAEIAYIAYTLNGADPRQRPVTFAFNGGPGAASAWLQLGAMGPWRLPLVSASTAPSAPPALVPNAETWLAFTDLVFIDPVGTGYSQIVGESSEGETPAAKRGGRPAAAIAGNREEGGPRYFWSVSGDIESIADFIQDWLKRADRTASPKMLVGESYGGFRAPKVAHVLQRQRGVGLNALVLVSPVLDFEGRRGGHMPAIYANLLPSLAAATLERQGKVPSRELLQDVETYARTDYLLDLLRGPRDKAAVDRIVAKVAGHTSLSEDIVRRYGGRVGSFAYIREINRPDQKVASFYDASVTGFDPNPGSGNGRFDDPFSTGLVTPITSAMVDLYGSRLQWRTERSYVLQSSRVNHGWVWGNSPSSPESISALKELLSLDPRFGVLVVHGFTDLVTPYAASEVLLDQLPAYGDRSRVTSIVYQGGHMFYSRDASRAAFRKDAEKLLAAALQRQGM